MTTASRPGTRSTVVSADGTRISYQRIGSGPPVVVLPAAMNPGEAWRSVAELLADEYTFLLVDRRHYPPSGPGPAPSSFAREVQDVRAMIEVAGRPVHLLGHSYGGLLAMETALADPSDIRTLLLYEAPVNVAERDVAGCLEHYRALLAAGNPIGAIGCFLNELVLVPADAMAQMAASDVEFAPEPEDIAALAEPLLHDIESLTGLSPDPARWAPIRLPVLLMAGANSWDPPLRGSTEALHRVFPHAEMAVWPGQTHFANMLAPEAVAATLREYLRTHG